MSRTWTRPAAWCAAGVLAVTLYPTAPHAADPPPPTKPRLVELPTKDLVANATPAASASVDTANPDVAPGLGEVAPVVRRRPGRAEKSGKPVLLFHMMGRLDQQFC